MALNNLKPLMKEPVVGEDAPTKPGLLKKKPAFKSVPKLPSTLFAKLTGGK